MVVGTFHSVALHFINSTGEELGYTGPLTVLPPDDCLMLLEESAASIGAVVNGKWRVAKSKVARYLQEIELTGDLPDKSLMGTIIKQYDRKMASHNLTSYGSLLRDWYRLILMMPERFEQYKSIYVDECQDLNRIQWSIVSQFKGSMFMVGDPRQAIYKFRGATPELFNLRVSQ